MPDQAKRHLVQKDEYFPVSKKKEIAAILSTENLQKDDSFEEEKSVSVDEATDRR